MAWRHFGWISLFVLILMAACGPPTVTDINGGASNDDDDVGTGDDDDDAATTFPTATTPPGTAPTLTNVPSFATWNSAIRPLAPTGTCSGGGGGGGCHGGQGGVYFDDTPDDASQSKFYWFCAICNRTEAAAPTAGMQSYSPPAGRYREYMTGNDPGHPGNIGTNNAATINNWLAQGGATVPPSCNDYYDLANSN